MIDDNDMDLKKSEWNEQQTFSGSYFKATDVLNYSRMHGDLNSIYTALVAKACIGLTVIDGTERDDIMNKLEEIGKQIVNERGSRNLRGSSQYNQQIDLMKLNRIDLKLNIAVDAVMPFLNKKKQLDIGGI